MSNDGLNLTWVTYVNDHYFNPGAMAAPTEYNIKNKYNCLHVKHTEKAQLRACNKNYLQNALKWFLPKRNKQTMHKSDNNDCVSSFLTAHKLIKTI